MLTEASGEINQPEVELKPLTDEEELKMMGEKIDNLLDRLTKKADQLKKDAAAAKIFENSNAFELMSGLTAQLIRQLEEVKDLPDQQTAKNAINKILAEVIAEGQELKGIEPKERDDIRAASLDWVLKLRIDPKVNRQRLMDSFTLHLKPFFTFLTAELRKLTK